MEGINPVMGAIGMWACLIAFNVNMLKHNWIEGLASYCVLLIVGALVYQRILYTREIRRRIRELRVCFY